MPLSPASQILTPLHDLPASPSHAPALSASSPGSSRDKGQLPAGSVIDSILELGSSHIRDDVSCVTTQAKLPFNKPSRNLDSPQDRDPWDMADAQAQLSQYRKRLARDLEMRERSARNSMAATGDKKRVSPIQEETGETRVEEMVNPNLTTTSTESGNTIRGGTTPGLIAATPSYPFPRMQTSARKSSNPNKPSSTASFTSHSPMSPTRFKFSFLERDLPSSSDTSASPFVFHPGGLAASPEAYRGRATEYPTPNLFDLSLMLTAEPGLDAWWETVVQIMTQVYKAERVTLSVPADVTDIENVPWGQKATYNEHQEDGLSLGYMVRSTGGSSCPQDLADVGSEIPSHADSLSEAPPRRPSLSTRHSFTTFEESKDRTGVPEQPTRRPLGLSRSKSYMPSAIPSKPEPNHSALNQSALQELAAADEDGAPTWEATLGQRRVAKARVLPVLQALDYEADPLIDHASVMKVLQRGKVIALTRSYPYLQPNATQDTNDPAVIPDEKESARRKSTLTHPEASPRKPELASSVGQSSKTSTPRDGTRSGRLKARFEEELHRPPSPKYEEYEQTPQSPWSQSPAPSPAVRADPKENPFFTDAVVDEDSFNPSASPADYSSISPPEAIGIDNSSSVLHIPLNHVLLSRTHQPFFDVTPIPRSESGGLGRGSDAVMSGTTTRCDFTPKASDDKPREAPIAILSILSPVIPYPSNLRRSLNYLSPHLATSFSLCQHYSTLETELAGIKRRRPHISGFGALTSDGRPIANPSSFANLTHLHPGELPTQSSLAGSMTSLSEYSGVSRSAVGSPIATPGVEQANLGVLADRAEKGPMTTSPLPVAEDGYFSAKHAPIIPRSEASSSAGRKGKAAASSRDGAALEKRRARGSSVASSQAPDLLDIKVVADKRRSIEDPAASSPNLSRERGDSHTSESKSVDADMAAQATESGTAKVSEGAFNHKPPPKHRHTMLHSYGADFATTFPSLPPSATLVSKPLPTRSGSVMTNVSTSNTEMPPPSDRLKGLILDSLPAHVFVALPQSGEVVWVSSRYLSYRGLSVGDLVADPWGSIHEEDREDYLKAWSHCLRTGEQFSRTVRIRRFDGAYRWFYARAVASRDKRGVIHHFLGSYMDIHDQRIAEVKAARQEQIAASEAKHKLLSNLIPQIIFTATENSGITSANEQWLSYTGQSFQDCLGLGFMDYVHPEDLAKCRIPSDPHQPRSPKKCPDRKPETPHDPLSLNDNPAALLRHLSGHVDITPTDSLLNMHMNGNASHKRDEDSPQSPISDLNELARKGVIKVARDSNGRLSYTTEVRLRSKSGEYRWHLVRCVEIDNVDFGDGASSYFGSATDINDHKLLEAKLKEAMESKSRFLSNMSHEIRTPLIGISGMVSFLQDTELNEEQRDYTNTIQTSANSLLMIINDILDLSKVAAGMMKLKFEWFHTRSLIEDVNELVSTMAIAKRLELNYIVEEDVPAWVKGDKIRIRQVLLNVIGNAIKFTSEGEVFSRCKVYRSADSHDPPSDEITLEFAIIDTGRGFTKEEAELIFKPFSQIDGSSTRQHGGSGLGLVISRQLVELHGGEMQGTAEPGKGSTFTFTAKFGLPTEEDHPELQPSPSSMPADHASHADTVPPLPSISASQPPRSRASSHASPDAGADLVLASGPQSSGSSNLSAESGLSMLTEGSSAPSIKAGLGTPLGVVPDPRPLVYSILIVCPQTHSREATSQHIATTLPKDVPCQIKALDSADEAQRLLNSDSGPRFTHIVLNLPTAEEVISLIQQTTKLTSQQGVVILVLSDTVQRQQVIRLASGTPCEKLLSEKQITFIHKPVKPSRFAVIFDPDKVRDLSVDLNRSTAQQMVESQKASYLEIEKRMGNKGYRVLLVEDNPVNQKVLTKYLKKVGVGVDIATDGLDCVEMVFSRPYGYYSLILCDLHMPRKDGYQACREVRDWERRKGKGARMPIIALSANVMSDVQDKCLAAGFSDYVTKPVDFIDLSRAMSKFF
ncbi:hypothetical protein jhhlp_001426 [Lomentospora prolificans]|uniref:Histidine kinase n=1 Tax=Lomentospora prolificans TaxID=41688 RepID=A0A2N3NI80_9PEZI|nr:hypothetical protein jhhlp_001426 [Lomentospora prolificans]